MPHRALNVAKNGMLDAYAATLAARAYVADAAQQAAAERLQRLYSELLAFKMARKGRLRRVFSRPQPPRGVYFWGGVGRGKSFLMDCFFNAVPYRRKRRVHFHAFMQEVHRRLDALKGEKDPLIALANAIAQKVRLLCFDEFHVADIADAMILGRLFTALTGRGVIFVITSNYPPDSLYANGLQRERFLPAIAQIKAALDVVEVDAGIDYRLRSLEEIGLYHFPADAAAEKKMSAYFAATEEGDGSRGKNIELAGRQVAVKRCGRGIVWFDFTAICDGPRAQADYLELARLFHTVMISGLRRMTPADANAARRFTWLVDVFYDHKVKLVLSAECPPEELYTSGIHANEFSRTLSRLSEMRSPDYLAQPHQPYVIAAV